MKSQSLFYWIIYSYNPWDNLDDLDLPGLNPYFIGLSILILLTIFFRSSFICSLNPYFIGLSILIILDYMNGITEYVSILILLDYLFL